MAVSAAASKEWPSTLLPLMSLPLLSFIENRVWPVLHDNSPFAGTSNPTVFGSKSRAPRQNCFGRSFCGVSIQYSEGTEPLWI